MPVTVGSTMKSSLMSSTELDVISPLLSMLRMPAAVNGPAGLALLSKPATVNTLLPAGMEDACGNASPTSTVGGPELSISINFKCVASMGKTSKLYGVVTPLTSVLITALPKGSPIATEPPVTVRLGGPVQTQLSLKSSWPLMIFPFASSVNAPTVLSGIGVVAPLKLTPQSVEFTPEVP